MIHPSATDIFKTIDATIEAKVIPALGDLDGRSAITTVRHLLRLVRVRIEEEGQILTDDIAELRKLRSEEHTSELQSLMRISYAVFCLKKRKAIPSTPRERESHIREQNDT